MLCLFSMGSSNLKRAIFEINHWYGRYHPTIKVLTLSGPNVSEYTNVTLLPKRERFF